MKRLILTSLAMACAANAALATTGAPRELRGSDTLKGVMTDVIRHARLESELRYAGGGSSTGEAAVLEGRQGIAPMSREVSHDALNQAAQKGIQFKQHVIGLDAIVVLVNDRNQTARLDLPTLSRIYSCNLTRWEDVPGSRARGEIRAYARDERSGTTELFRAKLGLQKLGPCVKELESTKAVAHATSSEELAIGYSGLPAQQTGNRAVSLAAHAGLEAISPSVENIRSSRYPLARGLFVYEADGSVRPSAPEAKLLAALLDRGVVNPILRTHEFVPVKE